MNLGGPLTVNLITTDITGFNIGNANSAGAANRSFFRALMRASRLVGAAGTTTTISAVLYWYVLQDGCGRMEMGNGTEPEHGQIRSQRLAL